MSLFIIYIIRWAVVLTLLYSIYGLIMKRETLHSLNRMVLLAVLAASMVLPLVQMETKQTNVIAEGRDMLEQQIKELQTSSLPLIGEEEQVEDTMATTSRPSRRETETGAVVLSAIILIYFIGLIIAWLRYIISLATLIRIIHIGKRIEIDGLPKGIKVLTHPAIKTPCSWMRWVLLTPADKNLITPLSNRRGVGGEALLCHELSHIHYGHSFDMLLCELTCRMLWCLPFAWMLRQDLRDVHEFQADRRVLQNGIDENEYQLLLIRKATTSGLQPVVNALNQSPIKRRFQMMYKKPSRRWVAMKAVYLLPLSALAIVAFARPQTMSEIEKKVEKEVVKYSAAMKQLTTYGGSSEAEIRQQRETDLNSPAQNKSLAEPVEQTELPDSNLVAADLHESGYSTMGDSAIKTPVELLDSTMQAVGARKIADGTYIGHFQPSLNSDTVRIALATIRNRQSQLENEHCFQKNANNPLAYNITLSAETRKGKSGYYIRYLQPVSSTLRNYDHKQVDPYMLSTDSVLTGHSSKRTELNRPVAIERKKKETHIFMYAGYKGKPQVDIWQQRNENLYSDFAIVDEQTGDKYVCRATDYTYMKYVKDEYIGKDTVSIYQVCLVFPPLGKNVKEAHIGSVKWDGRYSNTFDLNEIPRKGRVITN